MPGRNKLYNISQLFPDAKISRKTLYAILAFTWLFTNMVLYSVYGIETGFESVKYINEANRLLETGNYSSGNFLFYSVQILLIALSIKLQTGFWLVIAIQLLLNAFALLCFYKLVFVFSADLESTQWKPVGNEAIPREKRGGNKTVALLFAVALCTMPWFQLYNFMLFTESIYFSGTIIYCWLLLGKTKTPLVWLSVICLLILLIFSRPVGLFYIPATVVYLAIKAERKNVGWKLSGIVFLLVAFFALLNYAMGSGGEFNFLLPYLQGHIICGLPSNIQSEVISATEANSITSLWTLISSHPGLVMELAVKRVIVFFTGARSYYSTGHNLFLISWLVVLYGFIIFTLKRKFRYLRAEMLFLLTLLGFTLITAALTCDDWHNRFLLSMLPVLLLLAVPVINVRRPSEEASPSGNNH